MGRRDNTIGTRHILEMLNTALALATSLDGRKCETNEEAAEADIELTKAAVLANHACAELQEELFLLRYGA